MESAPTSYQSLAEQFELAKKQLGEAEETLKKITGRDPANLKNAGPGLPKWKFPPGQAQGPPFGQRPQFTVKKRPLFPIVKSMGEGNQGEESPEEDDTPSKKPSLQSTVVTTPKEVKSRRATIREQNVNSNVKARNRRMFGMILGTLQRFQSDASKRKEQDTKRAVIEQKVEAAAQEEKERIKREKSELFHTRKEKQVQLRCLEKKMEIVEMHEVWEKNQLQSVDYLKTKALPQLLYLPATHNKKTRKMLDESKAQALEHITQKRAEMENSLTDIEDLYKRDYIPGDKENVVAYDDYTPQEESGNTQEQQESVDIGHEQSSEPALHNENMLSDKSLLQENTLDNADAFNNNETSCNIEVSLNNESLDISGTPNKSPSPGEHISPHDNDSTSNNKDRSDDENTEENPKQADQEFEPIYD